MTDCLSCHVQEKQLRVKVTGVSKAKVTSVSKATNSNTTVTT